jgi:hypothetical protein
MEQTELFQEFERVIIGPEHIRRISDETREEGRRVSSVNVESDDRFVMPLVASYARRVLNLIRKPHEQWDRADYAFAAQVVEETRYRREVSAEHEPRDAESNDAVRTEVLKKEVAKRQCQFPRDEFDRRLWGLPPRPYLSQQ